MNRWLNLFPILLGVLLISCSTPTPANPPSATPATQAPAAVAPNPNKGQQLPISAVAVVPNGTSIDLEVAKTTQQQQIGLMYRPALPDNRGMLFEFPSPQPVAFWMKNVPVALDMVFIHQGVVQYIEDIAPPCVQEPCPTYGPNKLVDRVIELRAGRAAELKLKVGDRITIRFLNSLGKG
jgi:uncharacterized membrane protein (UPF0127 family)